MAPKPRDLGRQLLGKCGYLPDHFIFQLVFRLHVFKRHKIAFGVMHVRAAIDGDDTGRSLGCARLLDQNCFHLPVPLFDGGGSQVADSFHELPVRTWFSDRVCDCFEMAERAHDAIDRGSNGLSRRTAFDRRSRGRFLHARPPPAGVCAGKATTLAPTTARPC